MNETSIVARSGSVGSARAVSSRGAACARWCARSPHARIAAQASVELAVADVDRDHLARSALQQAVGEPAGRGAHVERAPACDRAAPLAASALASLIPPRETNAGSSVTRTSLDVDQLARLGRAALARPHAAPPRHHRRGRAAARCEQAALGQEGVETLLRASPYAIGSRDRCTQAERACRHLMLERASSSLRSAAETARTPSGRRRSAMQACVSAGAHRAFPAVERMRLTGAASAPAEPCGAARRGARAGARWTRIARAGAAQACATSRSEIAARDALGDALAGEADLLVQQRGLAVRHVAVGQPHAQDPRRPRARPR